MNKQFRSDSPVNMANCNNEDLERSQVSRKLLACLRLGLLAVGAVGFAQPAAAQKSAGTVLGVECARAIALGIDKQENLRASLIRIGCGMESAGEPDLDRGDGEAALGAGVTNVNTITGVETYPKVTQSESIVWSTPDGSTIVVNYTTPALRPTTIQGFRTWLAARSV